MIQGKKILLTGGAGFIGTTLAGRLVDQNHIVILDNYHRNALRHTSLLDHPNVKVIRGDVTLRGQPQPIVEQPTPQPKVARSLFTWRRLPESIRCFGCRSTP